MYGPIGHGFGWLGGIFAAIAWSIGVFVLLVILLVPIVLLARFLWVGTKAAQRYLELNGAPAPRVRTAAPTAPAATTPTTAAPPAKAAAPATTTKPVTTPLPKSKPPKPPTA